MWRRHTTKNGLLLKPTALYETHLEPLLSTGHQPEPFSQWQQSKTFDRNPTSGGITPNILRSLLALTLENHGRFHQKYCGDVNKAGISFFQAFQRLAHVDAGSRMGRSSFEFMPRPKIVL